MGDHANGAACEQGHWITSDLERGATPFCGRCGSPAVRHCSNCAEPLRGEYRGSISMRNPPLIAYCLQCGHPWPWTKGKTDAFFEMASATEELTEAEISNLRELLPHIVTEGPRTDVAAFKISVIISRVKGAGIAVLRDILSGIAVEAAKKNLGL